MEKLILYARKSTDTEDKQVLSIEAQLTELRKFARDNHLLVVDELVEKRTAKMPGRPVFNSLLTRIKNGEATGILAWHPDRLARNSVDGGEIVYLVDTGAITRLVFPTFWFEPTPQGKFMLNMAFGQSKYYVDSLSENTKRGLREKVRRGEFPGPAPIGYLNDYRTKTIVPDPQFAGVIRQIYETYSSGRYTLREISFLLKEKGAITRNKKPFHPSKVRWILSNPFYVGLFYYGGEIHEGSHPPIIEKSLFDKVQHILDERGHAVPKVKKQFAYCGLFHCPCGMMVTAEKHIKHFKNGNNPEYVYYRCTKKHRFVNCTEPAVRAEILNRELDEFLLSFAPTNDMLDWLNTRLEKDTNDSNNSQEMLRKNLSDQITNLGIKQNRLVDSYLEQDIDRTTFLAKKEQIVKEKQSLKEKLASLESGQNAWLELMRKWLETLGSIRKIVENGNPNQKKQLALEMFGSNLILSGKKIHLAGCEVGQGAGENGLATPAPRAHFRHYSELRSAIKNALSREDPEFCSMMVPGTGFEPAHRMAYAPKAYVSTNSTTRACTYYTTKIDP